MTLRLHNTLTQKLEPFEPLVPGTLAAPIHPNKTGMQGGANALLAAVK